MSENWKPGDSIARPVVTIDPEDREQVERLTAAYYGLPKVGNVDQMQAALREFANPTPQIEEPQNRYAVVLDADEVEWIRSRDGFWAHVQQEASGLTRWATRPWDDIAAVRVLSEGVTP